MPPSAGRGLLARLGRRAAPVRAHTARAAVKRRPAAVSPSVASAPAAARRWLGSVSATLPRCDCMFDVDGPAAVAGRDAMRQFGFCVVPGVLTREEAEAAAAEALAAVEAGTAHWSEETHTAFLANGDAGGGPPQRSAKSLVAYDQLAERSPVRDLYARDIVAAFVAHAVGRSQPLYRSADPLGAAYLNVYAAGDELGWHYDESQFFVSVLLQAPHEGEGEFLYVPEGHDAAAVLEGRPGAPKPLRLPEVRPGDMVVFRGARAMHRVTRVESPNRPRINAILTYETEEGRTLSPYTRQKFFGR